MTFHREDVIKLLTDFQNLLNERKNCMAKGVTDLYSYKNFIFVSEKVDEEHLTGQLQINNNIDKIGIVFHVEIMGDERFYTLVVCGINKLGWVQSNNIIIKKKYKSVREFEQNIRLLRRFDNLMNKYDLYKK